MAESDDEPLPVEHGHRPQLNLRRKGTANPAGLLHDLDRATVPVRDDLVAGRPATPCDDPRPGRQKQQETPLGRNALLVDLNMSRCIRRELVCRKEAMAAGPEIDIDRLHAAAETRVSCGGTSARERTGDQREHDEQDRREQPPHQRHVKTWLPPSCRRRRCPRRAADRADTRRTSPRGRACARH